MKRFLPFIALVAVGGAIIVLFRTPVAPAVNPDPNHTHADFLVMLDGSPIDFSSEDFMTDTSDGEREGGGAMAKFLHLHDGIGHVIHRHKPGLTLANFFEAIRVGFTAECVLYRAPLVRDITCAERPWRMVVNGQERPFSLNLDFVDGDKILLTTAGDDATLTAEWELLTDDACLYSRTCPWRGDPPAENCIADPEVPCVLPD